VWKAVDRKLKQIVALKKVYMKLLRFSMPSIMQLMLNGHSDKLCFYNSLMVYAYISSGH